MKFILKIICYTFYTVTFHNSGLYICCVSVVDRTADSVANCDLSFRFRKGLIS